MSSAAQTNMGAVSNYSPTIGAAATANVYYTDFYSYAYVDSADAGYSQLQLGTQDFCVEIFMNTMGGGGGIFSFGTSVGGPNLQIPEFFWASGGPSNYWSSANNSSLQQGNLNWGYSFVDYSGDVNNFCVNNWHHYALILKSGTLTHYIDGQPGYCSYYDTGTSSWIPAPYPGGINNFTYDLTALNPFYMFGGPLGQYDANNNLSFTTYWRNFRYTVGNSVYDTSKGYIVPPKWSDNLTAVSGTQILMVPGSGVTVGSTFVNEASPTTAINIQNLNPYGGGTSIVTGYGWPTPGGFYKGEYGASTNSAQTWTATGTPATAKITTVGPTPILGTSCGDFSMSGTSVGITASSPTWYGRANGDEFMIDGWVWVPTDASANTKTLITGDTAGSLAILLGTGVGNTDRMDQLSVMLVGTSTPVASASFVWTRGKWNYFCIQKNIFSDGTNYFENWFFWHGDQSQTHARGIPNLQTQGALATAFATPSNVYIGYSPTASGVSMGCYLNMFRMIGLAEQPGDAGTYPSRGVNIPYSIPAVDNSTLQLMMFQGTNGSTSFTNQTS